MHTFNYDEAFSRNHGFTSPDEQLRLKSATVAIAGMGGMGGDYLITLVRSGITQFNIADIDTFDLANFNRQYGATMATIGAHKTQTMADLAWAINPDARINCFNQGVTPETIDAFLDGVDVVIDAIEFFEIDTHRLLIDACRIKGIPVVFGVPLGYGGCVLVFTDKGMTFDDYFALDAELSPELKALKMSLACAPAGFHIRYINPDSVDLAKRKAPSMSAGCKLVTGMAITQTLMALLNPETLKPVPFFACYDARLNKFMKGRLWLGNRNPLQKLRFSITRRLLKL